MILLFQVIHIQSFWKSLQIYPYSSLNPVHFKLGNIFKLVPDGKESARSKRSNILAQEDSGEEGMASSPSAFLLYLENSVDEMFGVTKSHGKHNWANNITHWLTPPCHFHCLLSGHPYFLSDSCSAFHPSVLSPNSPSDATIDTYLDFVTVFFQNSQSSN